MAPELSDQLVEKVLAGANYKAVSPELIRNIGVEELAKRRNLKEAVKATKNKLHQVGGAYFKANQSYAAWLEALAAAAQAGDRGELLETCSMILGHHASTAERLPILPQFYSTILAKLPPVQQIVDIACGFNPLAIPWMPLPTDVEYLAYDIYQDMIDFLNSFFSLININGQAEVRDVIHDCPRQPADIAFILKAIPCLEQIDKLAGVQLLDRLNARHLVISFPVHSLGGKQKGMAVNYEARFQQLVADRAWSVQKIEFATELVFLVSK